MNKKVLVTIIVILTAIGIGTIYLLAGSDNRETGRQTVRQTDETAPEQNATATGGRYIDYSESAVASTKDTKLLFFHAPWCPQCRDLEADIVKNGVPDGVTIFKVDYDTSQELRQKYGVTLQTTVVRIDDNADLVKKFVAYDDPSLSAVVNNLL